MVGKRVLVRIMMPLRSIGHSNLTFTQNVEIPLWSSGVVVLSSIADPNESSSKFVSQQCIE